jgi:hypothetical protein
MNGHVAEPGEDAIPWCDWDAATDPPPGLPADIGVLPGPRARLHFSTEGYTKAWFEPHSACPFEPIVAIGRHGWIEFVNFGSAAQYDRPPEERDIIDQGSDFKVDWGERLYAFFHVEFEDDAVRTAQEDKKPLPLARIGGVFEGYFDFKLERSRAAQPFP